MPFAKRIVEPQWLCRRADADEEGLLLQDLCAFSNVALSRTLRQLSDLAKHACSLFQELEHELLATNRRVCALREKMSMIQETTGALDPKQEAVPLSNLDIESKLSGHYQAPWHLQRNVFLPSTRPACVEELHRNAKQSLRALYRDQQQRQEVGERERRVTISISMAPPMPTYPSPRAHRRRQQRDRPLTTFQSTRSSSPTECCHFSPWSRKVAPPVDSDSEVVALGHWPKCPIPNVPSMLDKQTNWAGILPLPTPEEKMKTDSQVINSCIVPINVTGVGFDREASVRCSLVHSQSVLQRRRKLRRRKTITGIPRRVQQDFDSDESPVARERTVMVHNNPEICQEDLTLSRLNTKDSGCQTEESLIVGAAPSRRRIRAQRGQGVTVSLSHSTGNISSLPDNSDTMFTASVGSRLRSRSLPREGGRLVDEGHDNSDEDDEEEDEEELSAFEAEDFLPVPGEHILKDDEESTDDQAIPEGQHNSLKFKQHAGSTEHDWIERGRSHLPRKADMGSCEISSSSDTFSSPIHSVSNAGVLTSQMDHKEDHQSSSGNWSGSSSTCPSQTSETIPPAASPPLTGSSHCDSELSLNAATNTNDDSTGFIVDPYPGDRSQGLHSHRTGSLTSTATDMLDDAGVSTASEGEWSYPHYRHNMPCHPDFSPEHSRAENILESPSFASIATFESLTDRPPSEKADTTSHFSVDAEGYYTSMHFDCGLKGSKSFTYNYTCIDKQQAEYGHQTSTLGRCSLSLRKPKVKPSPPKRSSSLKKISSHVGPPTDKNEPKNAVGQNKSMSSGERTQHVGLNRGSSSQLESEEPLGAWGVESSTEIPEVALSGSTETHSFKDEGAVQSDYADLWLLNDLKSNDPYRSLSNSSTATGTTVIECIKSQESSESQTSQSESRATTPSLPSVESEYRLPSPEKLVGLASPSSGYSSQSETPTSSLPSAFFPNAHPMSPTGGKRKPKVPERKSSLASFQKYSSKRDLELPIIPPSHLDLSALPNVSKPSIHTNQMHILDQSKQKAAAIAETKRESLATSVSSDELAVTSSLAITPTVLRSVQLRSVGKSGEGSHDRPITDTATRPKCPTVTIITPPTHDKPHETRKPPPYRPLFIETTSQDNCKSLFTPVDGLAAKNIASHFGARNRYDRLAPSPLWSMTAFKAPSEQVNMDEVMSENSREVAEDVSTSNNLFPQSSLELEQIQPWKSEPNEGSPCQNGLGKRSDGLDQVPDIVNQRSETLQAYLISSAEEESITSGVPTRSASQELVEEGSTPDTEDYFSKESTPSDPTESPLTDKSKTEDDSVFLSPSKSRTTEDLFAMIHRSKRKMLGRKDSEEMSVRSRLAVVSGNGSATNPATSPSTPNMPASPSTQTGAQRTPGSIYRSAKKSSTSNEEFKLLLLKKGSRSDSSYRMSATEILKSPVAPKSPGELLKEGSRPFEEPLSPFQQQLPEGTPEQMPSPFPKSYAEGFSPKAFPTSASTRQGRSRMPPAANSSRYSTRSRLYIAPMQAISEGETENSDGSPHDDRSS
ncbi:Nance-Horan syndrome protein isoform X5 [Sinocyclocheilus anshuiensis]|uniref:Nance-Horan syndrome protein isoform X5 n=1 Tax=Sinocyclocheilus anshuiensis TaxID=1608454 RepID=UPI0007B7F2EE|nr:PREDICTED: Nance-Horan syndrome protein-like isoform X5 [Sinocyclocheilus anshuiensis]